MPDEELWQQLFATKRDAEAQIERGHAERDRLAARVRELEAALWEMLSHYAPDPDDDTEAAVSAYAVLGEQAGSEEVLTCRCRPPLPPIVVCQPHKCRAASASPSAAGAANHEKTLALYDEERALVPPSTSDFYEWPEPAGNRR